jgi:hypothetical protein
MVGENASPEEFVVLASVVSRPAAERMVTSLGHKFRATARKGRASALVVSGNPDGSLKLTQSRAETTADLTAAVLRISASWMVGFMGLVSTLKGTRTSARAVRTREGHVGSGEHAAHAILAKGGQRSAIVLIRCQDQQMLQEISKQAADRAIDSWHGPLTEFLADLDPGSQHDWVRAALGKPADGKEDAGGGSPPATP